MNKIDELQHKFSGLTARYQDLAGILKGVFEDKIGLKNIGYSRVLYRIKTWDSFQKKLAEKNILTHSET